MREIRLVRIAESDAATFGTLFINNTPQFVTLELPWRDNKREVSRIPPGEYVCSKVFSPKYGETFLFEDVPGRDGVLFHSGAYVEHTKGCPLLGLEFHNHTGAMMIENGFEAMRRFRQLLKTDSKITCKVIDSFG